MAEDRKHERNEDEDCHHDSDERDCDERDCDERDCDEHHDGKDECDDRPHHGRRRGYGAWWWEPPWLWGGNRRQVALQERIFRDHQRQLDDFSKQVASGGYTAQSLVSEAWELWGRMVGDQADMIRAAYGLKVRPDRHDGSGPPVYSFSMELGDEARSFTLRLDSRLLPEEEVELSATALRSPDIAWAVAADKIQFKPARLRRGARAEQTVELTINVGKPGNQTRAGCYVGKLHAGNSQLGMLMLELTGNEKNLGA